MRYYLKKCLHIITEFRFVHLLIATAKGWHNERVSRFAAALSFYALLSLIPLLITFQALFSLFIDANTLNSGLESQLKTLVGTEQATAIKDMLDHAKSPTLNSLQALIGSLVTFVTAAGVFIELKDAMDVLWKAPKSENKGIWGVIKGYFAPMTMVLGFAFLLLISLLLDAIITTLISSLSTWEPAFFTFLVGGNILVSWIVAAILFAGIFRWLPAVKISWKEMWLGATITAGLFVAGKIVIGYYLGQSNFTSRYGSAGAIIAIIVWVYYSAQILYTGAILTREHMQQQRARRQAQHDNLP